MLDNEYPRLIVQPDDGVQSVVQFLRSATKVVCLKQFTFTHPLLLKEILAVHRKGVLVRVMLNGAKATGERLNDPFFEKMKSAGISVQWSNPAFLVTHEKSIVVDGKRALLASFNFMEKYFEATRDYGLVINDQAQVEQMQECFDRDWNREPFNPSANVGLAWSPGNARGLLCEMIDGARKTIDIQHPKFAEPVMLAKILAVMKRGVQVRILCGGKHGIHQPDLMYSFALWRLTHEAGAKVHKQKNLRSHAKLIIVDGRRAVLGSQNFDQPAFDLRREVSAVVHNDNILDRLVSVFSDDWAASAKYDPPDPMNHADEEEGELNKHAAVSHA